MTKHRADVHSGKLYGRRDDGELVELPRDYAVPDVVICRRLADYQAGQLPAAAAISACSRCGCAIAYNPRGPYPAVPRVCMQCARIQPLPIEEA